ncbi:glycoside hydrolase family 16 protein [Mycena floridula]|nr:glycoside hydrolase family 16 protein [Mycena floridula]
MLFTCLCAVVGLASMSLAQYSNSPSYTLVDSSHGDDFYTDRWNWETMPDPTHGRVNYVDRDTAMERNLTYVTYDSFVMRADDINMVQNQRGRDSIRISSVATMSSDSLVVLDVAHMPEGCATWPAFWTLSQQGPWPHGGEIDIIEGVNKVDKNLASLHTLPNCTMPNNRDQTGSVVTSNCDASVNFNQGCGTSFNSPGSYGEAFNQGGGGWYAMKRSPEDGVSVWFWSRDSATVPKGVRQHDIKLSTDDWDTPNAQFPTTSCDHDSHFNNHSIVINLTFCGDWAGNAFASSGCAAQTTTGNPQSCNDFVDNNPGAFSQAYWEINSLRIYELS